MSNLKQTDPSKMACVRALMAAVDAAERMPHGQLWLGEALCGALDTVGAGAPQYTAFGNTRDDATWWADLASPIELEIYAGAALRRIERVTFAERARKRLFMMLWNSFTKNQQGGFLRSQKGGDLPR